MAHIALSASSNTFVGTGGSLFSGACPGAITAFGLSVGTSGSAIATLWNSSGCNAGTEIWSLTGAPSSFNGIPFAFPLRFGASGAYLTIVGATAASAMVSWIR